MDNKVVHPLKQWLHDNNETQEEFAKRIGTSAHYISHLVTGWRTPSRKMARKITEATNGQITEIIMLYTPSKWGKGYYEPSAKEKDE